MFFPALGECSSGICDEASCINGGTCTTSKADRYICLCPLGFKGRHCEEGEQMSMLARNRVVRNNFCRAPDSGKHPF